MLWQYKPARFRAGEEASMQYRPVVDWGQLPDDWSYVEATSVAVDAEGRVFVADTWNQRVQVFGADFNYITQWPIVGWYGQSLDNKPYLTLDEQGRIYVSDNDGETFVVKAGKTFALLATNKLGERITASPAISGNELIYRTDSRLYCIGRK